MFKQKKLSRGARFGLYIASFLLGLLLFVAVTATALLADLRILTSGDNVREFVRDVFTEFMSAPTHVHAKAPIAPGNGGLRVAPIAKRTYNMLRREEPSGVASSLTDQLIGMFYEAVGEHVGEELPFSQEEFTQMINDSTVKDYVADKTADLIADYFVGEVTTTFEAQEVVDLINENAELIETITGAPLPEDLTQQIATIFDENEIVQKLEAEGLAGFMKLTGTAIPGLPATPDEDDKLNQAPEGGAMDAILSGDFASLNLNDIMDALREVTALSNLIWGIAICIVLMAAIILINCRQLGKGLRRAGYPLLWGGLGIIPCLAACFLPDLWTLFPGMALIQKLFVRLTVVYAVIFGTGLLLFIGGIAVGIVVRAKLKAAVSVPLSPEAEELAAALVDEVPVNISCEVAEEAAEAAVEETEVIIEEAASEEAVPAGE